MRRSLVCCLQILLLLTSTSCLVKDPVPTYSELEVTRGDIIVTSFTSDSVVAFDSQGNFKKVLYQLANPAGDAITGIAWLAASNEILISIDGVPDRIEAISVQTGASRNFYLNTTYFTGTPLALGVLGTSGDVIASEGATIERFSDNGVRETWTVIWPTSVQASTQQIVSLADGNWLACSSTAGLRISPDDTTALGAVASAVGGIAATTASYGCGQLSDGTIIVSWNGTSDAIQSYSSTLTGATTIISNPAVFGDPRGIAIGENDEIYVADATRNLIVQIDSSGNVIREFGNSYLQSPRALIVIPAFN